MTTPAFGPELLANGDLTAGSGIGAASVLPPGIGSDYVACGPNIFASPCGGSSWSFFTTNAGQVTGGFGPANPIQALGGRSMAVNVSNNPAADIVRWLNVPLVNGQQYQFSCDAAVINFPYSVAMQVDDGVQTVPLTVPAAASVWTRTTATFTWTGATGNHKISLNSNTNQLAGNDHTFDNFSLRTITTLQENVSNPVPAGCDCCPTGLEVCYGLGRTAYACGKPDGTLEWHDSQTDAIVPLPLPTPLRTERILDVPARPIPPDYWFEVLPPYNAPTQPAHAPTQPLVLDQGNYSNGLGGFTGTWVMRKIVHSDIAGVGSLSVPAGGPPLAADDQIRSIHVNGVAIAYPGVPGFMAAGSSAPVTWLAGDNTVDIEVLNTVSGHTGVNGRLDAITPTTCPGGN